MKAAFNIAPSQFEVRDVPVPEPAADEVLVRVHACAICGSDKNEFRGERPPRVAGHEFAGVIEALGAEAAGQGFEVGTRVAVSPLIGCGQCPICDTGDYGECGAMKGAIGYGPDGAFAEYTLAPVRNLVAVAESISFPEASLIEPTAVGIHAADRTNVAGKRCLVVGAGSVGLLVAQAALVRGAVEVALADTNDANLQVARSLGFGAILLGTDTAPVHAFDVAYECVGGHDAPLATAVGALRNHGILVLIGAGHPGGLSTDTLVSRRLTAIGSCGTSMPEMREAHDLIAAGRINAKAIISGTFPLAQMNEAFVAARTGQRVIVEP